MKRKIIYISVIVFVIALGIGISLYLTSNIDQENVALNHVYKSLDEIYEDSHLIVKAKIPDYYDERIGSYINENTSIIEQLYDIRIEKVYTNKTEYDVQKGDYLKIGLKTKLQLDRNDEMSYFPTINISELEQGTYLLFLVSYYDQSIGEYVIRTQPENIYKIDKNNKFKNIASHHLPEINELELEEKAKNQ